MKSQMKMQSTISSSSKKIVKYILSNRVFINKPKIYINSSDILSLNFNIITP